MKSALLFLFVLVAIGTAKAQQQEMRSPNHHFEEPYYCNTTISTLDFNRELAKIKQQPTIRRRTRAIQLASSYCLTANQVYKLCLAVPQNADRLSIAKKSYFNCPDQSNYDIVFNAMRTNAMMESLNEYITSYGFVPDETCHIHHHENNYYPNNNACRRPMAAADFLSAKQTINDASFDDTKLQTAKTIAATNCLSTDQVMEIARLFSFEDSKLQFAKYAYSRTYDKNNFFKVGTIFAFDASKTELNKYIQNNIN